MVIYANPLRMKPQTTPKNNPVGQTDLSLNMNENEKENEKEIK